MIGDATRSRESAIRSRRGTLWTIDRIARQPAALSALVVLGALLVAGALAPRLAPYTWDAIDLSAGNHAPELAGPHLFGTDVVGRDVLSRTLYGLQATEEVGFGAAALAAGIGVLLGAVAGYYGGWLDGLLMRLVDAVTSYPAVVVTLAAIIYFRVISTTILILVLGICLWPRVARIVRSNTASLRASSYVEAAQALGAGDLRILRSHLLPNVAGPMIVAATAVVGQAILLDATVEYLSYGMSAAVRPSLGNLIADLTNDGGLGVQGYRAIGWWTWAFPTIAMSLLLISVSFVGDGLDTALNPQAPRARRNQAQEP